jgi:hypothetical protein
MPIPLFTEEGDLPVGIYQANIDEVVAHFGSGSEKRKAVTKDLLIIYHLAQATGKLLRLIIFGSYVTIKPEPNDIDIILIVNDDFKIEEYDESIRKLFDHRQAQQELGASIFWIRPSMVLLESVDEFVAHWQLKRDRTLRGIIEVKL